MISGSMLTHLLQLFKCKMPKIGQKNSAMKTEFFYAFIYLPTIRNGDFLYDYIRSRNFLR